MEFMFLPLRRYAEFSGRSRRMEFWMWVVFQFLIVIGFVVLMMILGGAAILGAGSNPGAMVAAGGAVLVLYLLYALVSLALFIPSLAVTIRRLHDTDRSGWWVMLFWGPYLLSIVLTFALAAGSSDPTTLGAVNLILGLMMLVGGIVLLVFLFLEGTRGPNRFGADPKGRDTGQVFA
ncbi:MAG TPA: DUF805 domain-containing protein [Allosphingosinicella sp.]|jgi:uncharacterized membrane protein YhaH (DUF805 family)|nr:DUF805 domain-containing protein [Allosphingosinicella sp.]